jgi:hypothetical protein
MNTNYNSTIYTCEFRKKRLKSLFFRVIQPQLQQKSPSCHSKSLNYKDNRLYHCDSIDFLNMSYGQVLPFQLNDYYRLCTNILESFRI